MSSRLGVGVDIGGTKIAAALVREDATVMYRMEQATPRTGYEGVLHTVAGAVGALVEQAGTPVAAIGIGAPGVVDAVSGVVRSATGILPGWAGAPVRDWLQRRTGLPVRVDNDVRAMAYGEVTRGAGREYSDMLFVSLGTGVGGAMIRGGRLVRGGRGTAGEIAHLLVPGEGAIPCGCGRLDHLEAVASGPAMAADYARRTGSTPVALTDVASRLAAGDAAALACVAAAAACLGRTLAGVVTAMDFDAVIVGGGVAQLGAWLFEPLERALHDEVVGRAEPVPVAPPSLGRDGPVIGAALMGLDAVQEHGDGMELSS